MKVLVLENEADTRELVRVALSVKGCEVVTARCCKEAMNVLKSVSFDLAILDLGLPVVDGISCGERMKFDYPHMPLFAYTAYTKAVKPDHILRQAGFDACFRKGGTTEELVEAVINLGKEKGDAK